MAPRRSQRRAAEDEEDDDRSMDVEQDEGYAAGSNDQDISRKANELVRLALFHEHRRDVLRRDEITKKVLGKSKSFAPILKATQDILFNTFGMELVELKNRGLDDDGAPDEELDEARKATGAKKKATSGSKSYILRSKLDPAIIDASLETDEVIMEAEASGDEEEGTVPDEDAIPPYGTLISWPEPGATGILHVILALVLVTGRSIGDAELRAYLKKLRLSTIAFSSHSTTRDMPLDMYLQSLIKQSYLERISLDDVSKKGSAKAGKSKRVRADDGENPVKYEWRWGPRSYAEVGEEGVAAFVAEFMVGKGEGRDFDKMISGIGKAAGGGLVEG